jgi:hypothetical protein
MLRSSSITRQPLEEKKEVNINAAILETLISMQQDAITSHLDPEQRDLLEL